ncbi:ATP-binding cassette sub-family C member 9-like [Lingula anatina]|uniref:ATP-binding cassette sub-family C member 9-like n=1 Tax=Lingula anatina TaxID=7574 RepID=A0A2R2MTR8_LINAN|nr:ATP-binding cassette sub-family C member 9-like [Lingula anatina]|eukprot:XP_023933641.1 ATP-binding cassette sub-family C member 9-like [Lingula anatina]
MASQVVKKRMADPFPISKREKLPIKVLRYVCFKRKRHLSPPEELHRTRYYYSYASFLSQCTYWWMNRLLSKGYKKPLELKDLGKLPEAEWTVTNYKKLKSVFQAEKIKSESEQDKFSLIHCYGRVTWPMLCLSGFYRLAGDLLQFAAPLCISGIVTYVTVENGRASEMKNPAIRNNSTASSTLDLERPQHNLYVSPAEFVTNGYVLAMLLFLASLVMSTFLQNSHFLLIREGARIKVALQAMIYEKTLQLSSCPINSGQITSGQISNYMSNDVSIICMAFSLFHHVWAMPLLVILCLIMLHSQMGYSAVIGGCVVFILTPIQYKVASYAAFINQDIMTRQPDYIES